ncbi:MAG: hypothetical protein K0U47_12430 [Epsilonproteobacteria bacterium]|nr:hypothetical protein [Campylobacterota bacterium]
MKFLVTKTLDHNPLLKKLVWVVTAILLLFLILDLILHHYQIGLTLEAATSTIMGDEENFIDPILFDTLLERVHIDIFISLLTLLVISSIFVAVAKQTSVLNKLLHFSFSTAILSHITLLMGYYWGVTFIVFWIVLCILWHLLAMLMALMILIGLTR